MKQDKIELSRRQFMGIAGGVIGASALASMGVFASEQVVNTPEIDAKDFTSKSHTTDVLVIGGGIAGVFAAEKAFDAGASVIMVSKGRLGSSGQTPFGKGVFCYDKANSDYTIDEFVAKVSESALGTNNAVFTRQVAEHSYARVQELKSWGFFDSPLCHDSFMKPMAARNIPIHERIMITHLLKENGRIVGASGFSLDNKEVVTFLAKTVILCTGAGGFKPNGFPICDLTHDGTIMAYKIGAKVTGKEWNDGHPGSAENSGSCYDNWHGQIEEKPGLTGIEVHHDLGMDINYKVYASGGMSRSNNKPMGQPPSGKNSGPPPQKEEVTGGPYVPEAFQRKGPPEGGPPGGGKTSLLSRIFGNEKHQGPPGMGGNMVGGSTAGLAIHKSEGLVPIDETGLSTIPGLYAAGDALGSYMSGGIYTQIGSSMAGSAVQGGIAGEAAAKASEKIDTPSYSTAKREKIKEDMLAPLSRKQGYSPAWVTQTLQGIMIPNFILYIKKERLLQAALSYIEELKEHHMPNLLAKNLHELRLAHETENMIYTAEMKLRASIMRKESRCSHYRLDYPEIDDINWQAWLNIYQDSDGNMQLEKQPFATWPKV